ncbi:hypothetical protein E2C01_083049 [Portunus trituberculatus]|uniref:Uncharacterized protein n=1 Tax=Portunus trituberculatus TaxID=210409 RepID=A0A5B7J6R6_PORTR|nr:hypothetical protein [Portunus trituberculatus]
MYTHKTSLKAQSHSCMEGTGDVFMVVLEGARAGGCHNLNRSRKLQESNQRTRGRWASSGSRPADRTETCLGAT